MRPALAIAIVPLSVGVGLAHAADRQELALKTTEDLYRVCTTDASDPRQREALDLCEGFMIGAVGYHDAVTDRRNLKRLICYPPTITRDEGMQAFIAWAAQHQQDRKFMDDPAVVGLVRGLAAKWPCE